MAVRIPTIESTQQLTGLSFMYSVDTPVGRGADNKRIADVQLVQLFLNFFYKQNPQLFKKLPRPRGGGATEVLMDGKVGDQTIAAITEFQREVKRLGFGAEFIDGRVSIPVHGLRVPNSRHVYTIIQLNLFFFNTDPKNKEFNANLQDHPTVKGQLPELAGELGAGSSP